MSQAVWYPIVIKWGSGASAPRGLQTVRRMDLIEGSSVGPPAIDFRGALLDLILGYEMTIREGSMM